MVSFRNMKEKNRFIPLYRGNARIWNTVMMVRQYGIWTGRLHRIRCTMNQQKLSASAGALLNFGTENMS